MVVSVKSKQSWLCLPRWYSGVTFKSYVFKQFNRPEGLYAISCLRVAPVGRYALKKVAPKGALAAIAKNSILYLQGLSCLWILHLTCFYSKNCASTSSNSLI